MIQGPGHVFMMLEVSLNEEKCKILSSTCPKILRNVFNYAQ